MPTSQVLSFWWREVDAHTACCSESKHGGGQEREQFGGGRRDRGRLPVPFVFTPMV